MVYTHVKVIAAPCHKSLYGYTCAFSGGQQITDFPNVEEARAMGESQRAKGQAVIVRPAYNEIDDKGDFFREWRSFDGGDFQEVDWRIP